MGTIIGSFVGGLLAIGAAVLIYKKMTGKADPGKAATEAAPPETAPDSPDARGETAAWMHRLLELNIGIRTTYGLPQEVIDLVERVIDLLRETVPRMMERHPAESLTYELKRISEDHLPQIVKEFMDLSADSRKLHRAAFIASLGDIRDQIQRAGEIVEHNEIAEFKVMASFLRTKYSPGDL